MIDGRVKEAVQGGYYAKKQILGSNRIIAWSHLRRLEVGRTLLADHAGKRLLDYGSGDGTFIATIADLFPEAAGADIHPVEIESCRRRLAPISPNLQFHLLDDLLASGCSEQYDVITCMEVLEHCIEDDLDVALKNIAQLVQRNGRVIFSVPLESGTSLLIKEVFRTVAAWRRYGDYQHKERYRFSELMRMAFADERTTIYRPTHSLPGNVSIGRRDGGAGIKRSYGHKGFNWLRLRARIVEFGYRVRETRFSPFNTQHLASQVWLVCDPPLR